MMMIPRKRNEFDLFRDFFEGDDFFPIRRESAIMKTDIKEKKDKYIIEMDLPGYEKENINLSLKDGYLEVTAEVKKEDDNEEKDKFVHKERYYGHCSRSFYVGEQIKEEDVIKARKAHSDALLLVHPECLKEVTEKADCLRFLPNPAHFRYAPLYTAEVIEQGESINIGFTSDFPLPDEIIVKKYNNLV